jgi:hypothetical protein
MHRARHVGMAVTETRHGSAARRVEIFAAGGVDKTNAVAGHGERQRAAQLAMKYVRHGDLRARAKIACSDRSL